MLTQTTIKVEETNYIQAKDILSQVGLSYSDAITIFNRMIVLNNGLPFDVKIPTDNTIDAIKELQNRDGKSFNSVDELFDDLDS
jgi:DNA-damage-inducible protein J